MCNDSDIKTWFSHCIETHMDSLYALALRLTRNAADAEDLVAESVAKAWAAIASLDERAHFKPWMFRILHNGFISDYRKKAARPVEVSYEEPSIGDEGDEVDAILIQQPNEFLAWWANPERAFINNLLGEEIIAAIERLPEMFRLVVVLINIEGLSYDEAAQVLNVSPGTIRSRMNRGRTLLQKALWEHGKEAGLISDMTTAGCNL